jgi:hypothetical protein
MPQEHIDALVDHFTSLTPETAVEGLFTSTPEANTDDGTLGANDRYVAVDHTFYNFLKEMYAGE